ncbi:MAG: RNA polymerase sigma-54 factor [Syntrophorhabdus sp. PtaU1.Bin153]|nr:MAG: RNA polymerase sigma-54 factor [Syntrophorhabdus sp. PtaU1.Bin153]
MLELKQTQKLSPVLTQQLQQAIKLLQLSRLELMDAIELELQENPILELEEREPKDEAPEEEAPTADKDEVAEWLDRYSPSEDYVPQEERERPDYENMLRKTTNLRDHLRFQAGLAELDQGERIIAEWIIENIDDNGYLAFPLSELSEVSGFAAEELEAVLHKIQKLDPPGVGARDLQECIMLQYEARGRRDPIFEEVVGSHFDLFQKANVKEIVKQTGYSLETVKEVFEKVKEYDPKPGRNFSDDFTSYVSPDVYVVKTENGFEVFLNDDDLPELKMNRYYVDLYLNKATSQSTKNYIKKKVTQAEWFMKSIQQRQKTLYLVSKSIVAFQMEFLEKGLRFLRPLILKDVAQDVGVHESTVSRITTSKYMSTPHGVYEMKFFFPTGINKEEGRPLSTNVVMDLISEMIKQEDKRTPLTDDEIVSLLRERHTIKIARRTVAKYRDTLNISSSRERGILD